MLPKSMVATRVALLGLFALILSSCGGGDEPASAGASTEAARVHALALTPAQAALARWTAPISLPLVPISGAVLQTGKLLLWAADVPNNETYAWGGHTATALFDPSSNTAISFDVANTNHDMFCPGTARLPDGRVLVNGGLDAASTSIYDPAAGTWAKAPQMSVARGYNASVPLADGSVLTVGGSWHNAGVARASEVFTVANGWRTLTGVSTANPALITNDAQGYTRSDNHMWLIPTGNGRVLHAGPAHTMNWIDTSGNGTVTSAGLRGDDTDSMNGNAVMYDAGKILTLGGGINYDSAAGKAAAYLIDTTDGTARASKLAPMAYPRVFSNSVVLPTGQVVVMGGQTQGVGFSDSYAVLPAELWDPVSQTFTTLPAMSVARNYHSIGLLLPDGRVVSAGGGLCACSADHQDLQILSPPYLFNADGTAAARPAITAAPASLSYGSTVSVATDVPVASFSLVRLGVTTHTVNNDQRRIALTAVAGSNNSYQVTIPSNPGLLLPGQWMLFAINANGTPSIARMVTVDNSTAPVLPTPAFLTTTLGSAANLSFAATTASGTLSYGATNLPAGLTINTATGAITGTPQVTGSTRITVSASNGSATTSTDAVITVEMPGSGSGLSGQYFAAGAPGGTVLAQRNEAPGIGSDTPCAAEGGTCSFSGTQAVSYGANGTYITRSFNGSVTCSVAAFGSDPVSGVNKSCYLLTIGVPTQAASTSFMARWTGFVEPVASGATGFTVNTGVGVRVWVDGKLIIDTSQQATALMPTSGTANLVTGKLTTMMVEYAQSAGPLSLRWQPAGAPVAVAIPLAHLYPSTPSSTELAKGQPATQAGVGFGGSPGLAVDGNTSGDFNAGSVTHSGVGAQDWWQVDLGRSARIDLVQLWNRTDCCRARLNNFVLLVSNNDMTGRSLDQLTSAADVTVRSVGVIDIMPVLGIPVGAAGRYVRVQLRGNDALSLAEVQVYGTVYKLPSLTAIAGQQSPLNSAISLTANASDPDGNPMTYSASNLPPGLAIAPATGAITGTVTTAGSYSVTVSAANAGGLSASTSFNWSVQDLLPKVVTLPAPVAASGTTIGYNPTLTAGTVSQYSWSFGDGSSATAYANVATASHTFTGPGVYTVTLTIRAADGRSATQSFSQAIYTPGSAAMARSSSPVILEPRIGSSPRLWVVNADNDSVSVFDTANNSRLAEIPVGTAPRTLALAADGRVWVVNRDSASISMVSPSSLTVVQTLALPRASQPFGIVVNPNANDHSALVTLEATGQLLRLHGSTGQTLNTLAVGDRPRHLAITADGGRLLVSRFITRPLPGEGTATVSTTDAAGARLGGEVLVVDPSRFVLLGTTVLAHSERADAENQGRGIPNYLGAAAISPDGKTAWVPSKQDNIKRGTLRDGNPLNFQSTVRSISSRIDLGSLTEDLAGRVDHDNAGVASAAAYHPTGAYLFVALETNRQVAVVDAAGKRELFRYEVGFAPQGLVVSDDGLKLYVENFVDRSVTVVDLLPLVGFGQTSAPSTTTLASITTEKLAPAVLRGKQLFYDARDVRLARDSYMSCASCHNDGGHDGRTWDFTSLGEGLRNTTALKGRAGIGQGFMHWSANFDEVQDFEGQIRAFSGGTGLMSDADFNAGTRSQALGDRKAGISADLDALAAYLGSLTAFAPSPYRNPDGTMTAAAQLGRTVFTANCASCHGGDGFTLSADASQLKNIGTLKPSSGKRLNGTLPGIDIPTLRDVWATAPYLHDGSAATLSAAVGAHNTGTLNATDLANVVAYIQQIGSEEVQPAGNLALGKAATQSSEILWAGAGRAVDGSTDGVFGDNSVTHTDATVQPWWQVDLGQQSLLQSVRLWNRTDCCADRLSNFYVFVSASDMTGRTLAQLVADKTVANVLVASLNGSPNITLPMAAQGRFVRVQLAGTAGSYLSLAEVQVFGVPVNLAQAKAARQSSDAFAGWAGNAVDGNTDGTFNDGSVSHTDLAAQSWWQVDLGSAASLDAVQLWNRTDCCADRLSNFYVLASPVDMTGKTLAQLLADNTVKQVSIASLNGSPSVAVALGGFNARYVRVQLNGTGYLSLAEVKVTGR